MNVDRNVCWRELDSIFEELLQSWNVLIIEELGVDQEDTLVARDHIDGLDNIAHLAIFQPLSIFDFHKYMLPEDLLWSCFLDRLRRLLALMRLLTGGL